MTEISGYGTTYNEEPSNEEQAAAVLSKPTAVRTLGGYYSDSGSWSDARPTGESIPYYQEEGKTYTIGESTVSPASVTTQKSKLWLEKEKEILRQTNFTPEQIAALEESKGDTLEPIRNWLYDLNLSPTREQHPAEQQSREAASLNLGKVGETIEEFRSNASPFLLVALAAGAALTAYFILR